MSMWWVRTKSETWTWMTKIFKMSICQGEIKIFHHPQKRMWIWPTEWARYEHNSQRFQCQLPKKLGLRVAMHYKWQSTLQYNLNWNSYLIELNSNTLNGIRFNSNSTIGFNFYFFNAKWWRR
jgi:hypothetical protein